MDFLLVDIGQISDAKVKTAIQLLKSGKAAGLDEYLPIILKHDEAQLEAALRRPLNTCWSTSCVPYDWTKGVITKLPTKGYLGDCKNCRGIMLLSVPRKVLCLVLLNWLRHSVDERL